MVQTQKSFWNKNKPWKGKLLRKNIFMDDDETEVETISDVFLQTEDDGTEVKVVLEEKH